MQNKEIDLHEGYFDAMYEWAEQAPDTRVIICLASETKGKEVSIPALIDGENRLIIGTLQAAMQKSQEFATAVVAAANLFVARLLGDDDEPQDPDEE